MKFRRLAVGVICLVGFTALLLGAGRLLKTWLPHANTAVQVTDYVVLAAYVIPSAIVGAVVNRPRALLLPLGAMIGILFIAYLKDPTCSQCGEDTFATYVVIACAYAAGLMIVMLVGVAVRNVVDRLRSRGNTLSTNQRI